MVDGWKMMQRTWPTTNNGMDLRADVSLLVTGKESPAHGRRFGSFDTKLSVRKVRSRRSPLLHQQDGHQHQQNKNKNTGNDSSDFHHPVGLFARVGDDLRLLCSICKTIKQVFLSAKVGGALFFLALT